MNYFELYDLPVTFHPNQQLVKQKFYELSKKYHPDFYINSSIEKQEEVLAFSTLNNKAYQVLKDFQSTLHYILTLKNQLVEGENYILPQEFLMEMMEINESLMDLEFDPDSEKMAILITQIKQAEKTVLAELQTLSLSYDTDRHLTQANTLAAIKDLYYRNKYLLRIKERVGNT